MGIIAEYVFDKTLPNYLKDMGKIEITQSAVPNLCDAIPFISKVLGLKYVDSGKLKSYITADIGKLEEETLFARAITDGVPFELRPVSVDDPDGSGKFVAAHQYHLICKNPKSRHFLPTTESITSAMNVETEFVYETILRTDDGEYSCYIYIPVKTGGMGSVNLLDQIRDLENILENAYAMVDIIPGTKIDKEVNSLFIPFSNKFGDYTHLEFDLKHLGEVMDMVVSIRMVQLETKIIENGGE